MIGPPVGWNPLSSQPAVLSVINGMLTPVDNPRCILTGAGQSITQERCHVTYTPQAPYRIRKFDGGAGQLGLAHQFFDQINGKDLSLTTEGANSNGHGDDAFAGGSARAFDLDIARHQHFGRTPQMQGVEHCGRPHRGQAIPQIFGLDALPEALFLIALFLEEQLIGRRNQGIFFLMQIRWRLADHPFRHLSC